MAAVSGRHKLVVSASDTPWLYDTIDDPGEMKNLFLDPASRETVRTMARAFRDYGRTFHDPALDNPVIVADLAWAADGTGVYEPGPRLNAAGAGRGAKAGKGGKAAGAAGKGRKKKSEDDE